MSLFRQSCQKVQVELRQKISLKRLHLSPAGSIPASPRLKQTVNSESTTPVVSPRKKLSFGRKPVQHIQPNINYTASINSNISANHDAHCADIITENDKINIIKALDTNEVNMIATIPTIQLAAKQLILKEVDKSCKSLCKRNENSSMLLDNSYKGLAEFSFDLLWTELLGNHRFLVDLLNSVSGKNHKACDTPKDLQTKYCFIYSVLMNARWHELSLVQRVNTVLIIEGGCSKQV